MPRIVIVSNRWSTLQWIWRKGEIFKKRTREREVMGNAGSSLRATQREEWE